MAINPVSLISTKGWYGISKKLYTTVKCLEVKNKDKEFRLNFQIVLKFGKENIKTEENLDIFLLNKHKRSIMEIWKMDNIMAKVT